MSLSANHCIADGYSRDLQLLPNNLIPPNEIIFVHLLSSIRISSWKPFRLLPYPGPSISIYLDSYFKFVKEWFRCNAPEEDRLGNLMSDLHLSDDLQNEPVTSSKSRTTT